MSLSELHERLTGISAVTITPFVDGTRDVDEEGLRRIVATVEAGGVDVIVPCGGTGEYYALTEAERRHVVEIVTDAAQSIPVVAGVGTGLREAVSAAEHAEDCGAAGVMVHQPVGAGVHARGVVDYYREIAGAISIGVVAYVRDPMFSPEILVDIASIENVVGVKYAITDPRLFAATVAAVNESASLTWICGSAESWAPSFWPAGATGFTSGLANFAPHVSVRMRDALRSGDLAAIRRSWAEIQPLEALRDRHRGSNNISVVKAACQLAGLCGDAVRPPLHRLSPEDRRDLEDLLSSWSTGVSGDPSHATASEPLAASGVRQPRAQA